MSSGAQAGSGSDTGPVVILGGGLTGISTAVHLRAPWVLFEREERLGGHARTDERDGSPLRQDRPLAAPARSGASSRWSTSCCPARCAHRAQGADLLARGAHPLSRTRPTCTAAARGDQGVPAGRHRGAELTAASTGAGGRQPRDFEEYCLRHFGAGISKHFMIPYNEKIWGVHPREITAEWCSRFVPLPNLEQVIAGAVGAGPPEMGYNQSFLYPKSGGIETFTRALTTRMAGGRCTPALEPRHHRLAAARGGRGRRADPLPRGRGHHPAARAAEAHAGAAARDRARGDAPALHDAALPQHRRARQAARRLALDLRPREALSVLPGERVFDRHGQHGPRGALVDLRGDGRPRTDRRGDRARHDGGAGRGGRPAAAPTTCCSRRRNRSNMPTSCSTSTTTRPRAPSSLSSRPTASTRAGATAPGPTTPWRTACWPGARWRRWSTRRDRASGAARLG